MSRRWVALLALASVLAVGSTTASGEGSKGPRSEDVFPAQRLSITFSHVRHTELGVQCVTCHGAAPTSEDARDDLVAGHEICTLCHLVQAPNAAELYPKSACSTCHVAYEGAAEWVDAVGLPTADAEPPPRIEIPPAHLTFSHRVHVDQGVPCLQCHAGADKVDLATREHLPDMYTCLECHTGASAPSECTTCHLQGDGGRILTGLGGADPLKPRGRFRPDDHGSPWWLQNHQAGARADEASCGACHEPAACLDCHDGNDKPLALHPADWVMTHGLEAQRRTLECGACHDLVLDCQSCHLAAGVTPGQFPSPTSADNPGMSRFHPVGWGGVAGEIPGAEHHSFVARRSLETCAACHSGEGEGLCLECHAGVVNPHPASWGETSGNWRLGQGEGQVCFQCHLPGDPNLSAVTPR